MPKTLTEMYERAEAARSPAEQARMDAEAAAIAAAMQRGPTPRPAPGTPSTPVSLRQTRRSATPRKPRAFEQRVMSLTAIPLRLDRAVADLKISLPPLLMELATDALSTSALAMMTEIVRVAMREMATYGGEEVRLELTRQGARLSDTSTIPRETSDSSVDIVMSDVQTQVTQLRAEVSRALGRRKIPVAKLARVTAEALDRRVPALANQLARRVVHGGFSVGRAAEMRALRATDRVDLARGDTQVAFDQVMQTAVLDGVVCEACFIAGTAIATASGSVSIELLRVGDRVFGGDGRLHDVVATHCNSADALVDIRVGAIDVSCTLNHPFWIGRGDRWQWRQAGEIRPGDRVLLNEPTQPQPKGVLGNDDLFGDTDRRKPVLGGPSGLRGVAPLDGRRAVPKGTVYVNHDIGAVNREIPHVVMDADLRSNTDTQQAQRQTELNLSTTLATVPHVARLRTKAASGQSGRANGEHLLAMGTGERREWPVTGLGAVFFIAGDSNTAPSTESPLRGMLTLAGHRADFHFRDIRREAEKFFLAEPTRQQDFSATPSNLITVQRAINGRPIRALGARTERDLADGTGRIWSSSKRPAFAIRTRSAADRSLMRVHGSDRVAVGAPYVLEIPAPRLNCAEVLSVSFRPFNGRVYNITVDHEQTYFAHDILVHNCSKVDGEVMEFGSDRQQELEPPYYRCRGGDNCRCQQIPVYGDQS